MRIATFGRLEIPERGTLRVHVLDAVDDLSVHVRIEVTVGLNVLLEIHRKSAEPCDTLELYWRNLRRPSPCADDFDVVPIVDDRIRKALPLDEVDQVGCDVDQTFTLLRDVEEPCRSLDRRAGDQLGNEVHTLFGDCRCLRGALRELAEDRRTPREGLS